MGKLNTSKKTEQIPLQKDDKPHSNSIVPQALEKAIDVQKLFAMHTESNTKPISFQLCDKVTALTKTKKSDESLYDLNIDISSILRLNQEGQFPISTYTQTGETLLSDSKAIYDLLDELVELQQMEDKEVNINRVQTIIGEIQKRANQKPIIGIVGAYAEGKTHIINALTGANFATGPLPVTAGTNFTTIGNITLIDTPGHHVPVNDVTSPEITEGIQDKMSTEYSIRNALLPSCDYYIYVTSRITSKDQKIILHLSSLKASKDINDPALYVAHNLKDITSPAGKDLPEYIKRLVNCFPNSVVELSYENGRVAQFHPIKNTGNGEIGTVENSPLEFPLTLDPAFSQAFREKGLFTTPKLPIVTVTTLLSNEKFKTEIRHVFILNKFSKEWNKRVFDYLKVMLNAHRKMTECHYPLLTFMYNLEKQINHLVTLRPPAINTIKSPKVSNNKPEGGFKLQVEDINAEWHLNMIKEDVIQNISSSYKPAKSIYLCTNEPQVVGYPQKYLKLIFDTPGVCVVNAQLANLHTMCITLERKDENHRGEKIFGWVDGEERGFGVSPKYMLSFSDKPFNEFKPHRAVSYYEKGLTIFLFPPYYVGEQDWPPQDVTKKDSFIMYEI